MGRFKDGRYQASTKWSFHELTHTTILGMIYMGISAKRICWWFRWRTQFTELGWIDTTNQREIMLHILAKSLWVLFKCEICWDYLLQTFSMFSTVMMNTGVAGWSQVGPKGFCFVAWEAALVRQRQSPFPLVNPAKKRWWHFIYLYMHRTQHALPSGNST